MKINRGVVVSAQTSHQDVGLRMHSGLFFRDFPTVDQSLDIGVVHRPFDKTAAVVVIDARIASMSPVAVALGVNQKCGQGAVGFLFG